MLPSETSPMSRKAFLGWLFGFASVVLGLQFIADLASNSKTISKPESPSYGSSSYGGKA